MKGISDTALLCSALSMEDTTEHFRVGEEKSHLYFGLPKAFPPTPTLPSHSKAIPGSDFPPTQRIVRPCCISFIALGDICPSLIYFVFPLSLLHTPECKQRDSKKLHSDLPMPRTYQVLDIH